MSDENGENTIYGVAVVVIKDGQVIMSRRTETVVIPKKWQFVHGRLKRGELSIEAAIRLVYDQMDIAINDKMRFKFVNSVQPNDKELYFVYLVNLNKDEVPINTCDRFRGDWRVFDLDKAAVLDVIDGIRPILRKLLKTKLKYEVYKQTAMGVLTEREARTLAKLGPKMTRLI